MKSKNASKPMRISNILLLALVAVISLSVCIVIVSINQSYASKDYTYVNNDKTKYKKVAIQQSLIVKISNVPNCFVVSSDSLSVEVFDDEASSYKISSAHDTLNIVGLGARSEKLLVYVPDNIHIIADSTSLEMRGTFDFLHQTSVEVSLQNSKLRMATNDAHVFFGAVKVIGGEGARIEVGDKVHIRSLELDNVSDVTLAKGWQVSSLKTTFNQEQLTELRKVGDSVFVNSRRK